jgi:hypothetical protein
VSLIQFLFKWTHLKISSEQNLLALFTYPYLFSYPHMHVWRVDFSFQMTNQMISNDTSFTQIGVRFQIYWQLFFDQRKCSLRMYADIFLHWKLIFALGEKVLSNGSQSEWPNWANFLIHVGLLFTLCSFFNWKNPEFFGFVNIATVSSLFWQKWIWL